MPKLETIYEPKIYTTPQELTDWMIKANAYGFVTRNQGKAIVQKLTPMLPITAALAIRSYKGVIYMTAGETRFRVSQRGAIIDKPWNPNPRGTPRNPWLD